MKNVSIDLEQQRQQQMQQRWKAAGAGESLDSPAATTTKTKQQQSGSMESARSVSLGMTYEVCPDLNVVTAVKDAATYNSSGDDGEPVLGPAMGSRKSLYDSSCPPVLDRAFSTKTLQQLKMARGKSYEGEEFALSWTITLQVDVVPSAASKAKAKATGEAAPAYKKTILDGIVGHATKGSLLGVMGSSGCGKTSFLDCVSMRNQSFRGNIFVSSASGTKEIDGRYFALAGFVPQDDIFIPTETVREHLTFHALLRCDPCVRTELRLARVDQLLKATNLGHVADSMLGGPGSFVRGLSGGERRRVSFATELLSDPVVLLLDEFTTGLDAAMAKSVCLTLRNIAAEGRLVIGTIHQPSSDVFSLFTHIMLMTQGRVVYMGPRKTLAQHFEGLGNPAFACPPNHNPADFYVQLIALNPDLPEESQARIDTLVAAYDASAQKATLAEWQATVPDPDLLTYHRKFKMRHFQASGRTQFWLASRRNVRALVRDPLTFGAALFSGVVTGLILGLAYSAPPNAPVTAQQVKDMEGLFFLVNLQVFLICIYATIMAFSAENKVFMRENQVGAMRVGSYYLSKTLTGWAVEILTPFVFAVLVWAFAGLQRSAGAFFIFAGITVLNALCFGSLGYCLAAMTSDPQVAMALAPVLALPNVVFSGLLYDLRIAHGVRLFLSYASILRYSEGAMLVNEYRPEPAGRYTPAFPNPAAVLGRVEAFSLRTNVWALVGAAVLFRVVAYVILLLRTRRERVKVL